MKVLEKQNHKLFLALGVIAVILVLFVSGSGFNTFSEQLFTIPTLKVTPQSASTIDCTLRVSLFSQTNDGRIIEVSEDTKSLQPLDLVDPNTNEELTNLQMRIQDKCNANNVNLDSTNIGLHVYVDNRQCFIGNWCYTFIERITLFEEPAESKTVNKRIMDKYTTVTESKKFDIADFNAELTQRFFTDDAEIIFEPSGSLTYSVNGETSIIDIDPDKSKVSWVVKVV